MGDEAPTTLELTCPGCGAFFRLKPKRGRLPKGPIPCPKCATSIPVPSATTTTSSAQVGEEDSFAQRPRTSKTTAPMAQVMGSGIIKRKKRDGESSQLGIPSSQSTSEPAEPAKSAEAELPEHSSPRLKAPSAMDRLLDDAPGPGATFLGLPTLGDSGLGVIRAELDAAQEPLRAQRLDEGQVPEYTMPLTSSQQGDFSREDSADEELLAKLSSQRSTREVPTTQIEPAARPEHLRDTQEVDPVDPQEHRKTPINLERPPIDMFDAPLDDDDDELAPPTDDWGDGQGPFDLRDILAAEKERGNELSGEITRNPALEGGGGLYPVPEPSKSKPLPDDSFGAHIKRPRSKHLATLSVSAQSPEHDHRETSDRSNSGAFKHARVSTGDIFSETSSALNDDSLFPVFEAKQSAKPLPTDLEEASPAQLESLEPSEQEELHQTPRTTAEYDPISPADHLAEVAKIEEPQAPQPSQTLQEESEQESSPALSALLKRKIGKKKADELRHKIEQEEPVDEQVEEPVSGLAQDSGLSSLDALFDEQQSKSKFGPSPINPSAPSSSFNSGELISEDDLMDAVSSASESWSKAFEEEQAQQEPAQGSSALFAAPLHDTSPTREALNPSDLWDELARDESEVQEAQEQRKEADQPPREDEIKTPVMSLSPPVLPESSKPLISALKAKLLERQSSLQERSEAQAQPTSTPLLEATKPKLSLGALGKAQEPTKPARPTELPTLDLKTPSEAKPDFDAEPHFNDRSGSSLISGFPSSSQSTDELKIIRSKRRRGGNDSQSGLFARPLADGLGQESSVTMGMAGERRGSGYIRLPTTEILEVLGQGSYRLMVEEIVYEPVDEQGLVDLIKQGVLLGAEQIAEADGDWTPIAEHPVFKRLRKKMAMEAHAVLAKYKRQAAQSSDQLPAIKPPEQDKKSGAKGFTKPLTPVSPVAETTQEQLSVAPDAQLRVSQEITIDRENPHHEETRELTFDPQEAQRLGREEPQQEQEQAATPPEPGVDEAGLFFDDELEAQLHEELEDELSEPAPEPEPQTEDDAADELAPTQLFEAQEPAVQDELPLDEPKLDQAPSKTRWLLPLLLVVLLCGLAVGAIAMFKPELLGLATTQPTPPTTNNVPPPVTPPVVVAAADASPDAAPAVVEPEIEKSDLERALAFEQAGDFAAAIPLLEKLHQSDPKDIDNINFLTRVYLGDKQYAQARATALLGLSQPKIKKDEAEQLQKLYQQGIISDPLLTQTSARLLKLDEDLDALHFIEEDKLFQVKVLKDGKTTHVFKPAQVEWGSGWRQEVATWRLSELMASSFSVPQTEAVRISEDDFMALYQRHDSELQKKGLNRIREWDELDWVNEKGADGVKRRYLYGALQRWVEPRVAFPVEYTNAWQDLVNVDEDERVLEQPIQKTLEPIERADKARYEQIVTQLGDLNTKGLASQLSDLMIMDYLINHRPRFERRSEDYGKATQLKDGQLYSLMHGVSWGLRASSTISSRFRNVSRFSRQSITALELMEPKFVDGILFPDADSREKKRLKIFWAQRNKTLRKVKKLTEDYSQEAVLYFP